MNKTLRRAIDELPKRLYLGCVERPYSEINLQSAPDGQHGRTGITRCDEEKDL
jgi:hypothetical protein